MLSALLVVTRKGPETRIVSSMEGVVVDETIRLVISPDTIRKRISEMGRLISESYGDERPVAVCVLKGAYMFFADLVRAMPVDPEVEFIRVASYHGKTVSSGRVSFTKDVEVSLKDRHVLVVEDIVDSGRSMDFVIKQFAAREPKSIKTCTLVNKTGRRELNFTVDYPGFTLENGFVVGYGMDYDEKYRTLDGIYVIEE